jgi:acyl carrier protein
LEKEAFLIKLAGVLHAGDGPLDEAHSLNNKNWDSVARLGAIALIDELYGITVPTRELEDCMTVRDLVALIQRHVP